MKIIDEFNNGLLEKKIIEPALKRNYGIDLLKIVAMINIINLHINRDSLLSLHPKHPKYKQVYRLQTFSFWPVNAFGIISGLVNYKRYKFSNLIYIWFEYVYYSVILSLYLYYKSLLNSRELFLSFFPIAKKRFWYANAYFFLYLFLPILNNSINVIDKGKFIKLIGLNFFVYSLYHTLIEYNIGQTNFDFINDGYSSLWLIILYIVGGYLGKYYIYKPLLPNFSFFCLYLLSSVFSSEYIFYSFKKYKVPSTILMRHNSPTIIIQSLSLIFLFYKLKINNKYFQKMILFFNPLNFNVALIHLRVFSYKTPTISRFFIYIRTLTQKYLFFKIYGISIIIYFICAFFDYFRFILFKLLKIRNLCNYIEKMLF